MFNVHMKAKVCKLNFMNYKTNKKQTLTNINNNSGPKLDPCRTPMAATKGLEPKTV